MPVLRRGDHQSGEREGRRVELLALRRVRRDVESEPDAGGARPAKLVGPPMNTIWIIAGLAVVGAIIALVHAWQQRRGDQDLGAVSHQWIAEHRLGHANDSRR
jgi:hypothetical protein